MAKSRRTVDAGQTADAVGEIVQVNLLAEKLAVAQELIKAQAYLILCYRTRKSRVIAEKNVKLAEEKYKALGG